MFGVPPLDASPCAATFHLEAGDLPVTSACDVRLLTTVVMVLTVVEMPHSSQSCEHKKKKQNDGGAKRPSEAGEEGWGRGKECVDVFSRNRLR